MNVVALVGFASLAGIARLVSLAYRYGSGSSLCVALLGAAFGAVWVGGWRGGGPAASCLLASLLGIWFRCLGAAHTSHGPWAALRDGYRGIGRLVAWLGLGAVIGLGHAPMGAVGLDFWFPAALVAVAILVTLGMDRVSKVHEKSALGVLACAHVAVLVAAGLGVSARGDLGAWGLVVACSTLLVWESATGTWLGTPGIGNLFVAMLVTVGAAAGCYYVLVSVFPVAGLLNLWWAWGLGVAAGAQFQARRPGGAVKGAAAPPGWKTLSRRN